MKLITVLLAGAASEKAASAVLKEISGLSSALSLDYRKAENGQ